MTSNPEQSNIFVFDFDGTIADTFKQIIEITNQLSNEFHFDKIKWDEIDKLKDKSSQEVCRYLNIPLIKVPFILAKAKQELNKEISSTQPIQGLKEMLLALKEAGHHIGILTSNSAKNVKEFLTTHKLDIFDFIHTTSKFWGKNKSLSTLMNNYGFQNTNTFYVGDETRDIEAARKAGIRMIAVTWGYNSHKALTSYHPDYLIHKPDELIQLGDCK